MNQGAKTKRLVVMAVFSSIAYLLMMLDFPIGLSAFLKMDFSELPVLIVALIYGPGAGLIVEAIKNLLYYLIQGSATGVPVGQVANFVAGAAFILPVSYMFRKYRTTKGLTFGVVTGTVLMAVLMAVLNYYVFLPAYTMFLHMPAYTSSGARELIVKGILPFNLIKGVLTGVIFVLLFTRMKTWLTKQVAM